LDVDDGLSGLEVKAILQTSDGSIWLGTESGLTRITAEALRGL